MAMWTLTSDSTAVKLVFIQNCLETVQKLSEKANTKLHYDTSETSFWYTKTCHLSVSNTARQVSINYIASSGSGLFDSNY